MRKRTPQDWETLKRRLHAAGVSPEEIEAAARTLLAQARGHQLAQARKQLGLAQRDIATAMGVSVARVSQVEHGEVTSFEVLAATSKHSEGGSTSSPISATAPPGYRSPIPPSPSPPDNQPPPC